MIKNFLKKIYITKEVSRLINFISSPWKGRGAILMYHRILPDDKMNEDLDLGMAVSCSDFEKQIKTLKSKYSLVSIDDFIKNLENNKKIFMVNITFDDGYKDNIEIAFPILDEYNIPMHIFITSQIVRHNLLFWPDLLGYICSEIKGEYEFKKKCC